MRKEARGGFISRRIGRKLVEVVLDGTTAALQVDPSDLLIDDGSTLNEENCVAGRRVFYATGDSMPGHSNIAPDTSDKAGAVEVLVAVLDSEDDPGSLDVVAWSGEDLRNYACVHVRW